MHFFLHIALVLICRFISVISDGCLPIRLLNSPKYSQLLHFTVCSVCVCVNTSVSVFEFCVSQWYLAKLNSTQKPFRQDFPSSFPLLLHLSISPSIHFVSSRADSSSQSPLTPILMAIASYYFWSFCFNTKKNYFFLSLSI